MKIHRRTPKILGVLLTYPESEIIDACPEIKALLREEKVVSTQMLKRLEQLISLFEETDLLDLQENYVALFDRTPSLALHLFEHVHGDSRDRGRALVDLDRLYKEAGLQNCSEHTPDYLPLFLEYLSMLEAKKAREELGGAVTVIAILEERLRTRGSLYAHVFSALKKMAGRRPNSALVKKALETDSGQAMTTAEMDAAWVEQFAHGDHTDQTNSGCPRTPTPLQPMETRS